MANTNSPAKIALARKNFQAAREAMVLQKANLPEYDKMSASFEKLAPRLLDENVQTADLDPVFALAKNVSAIAKVAEAVAKRAKQEKSLAHKYETASGLLARWSGKMPAELATSLIERMADAALDCTEPAQVKDLQPLFKLCDQVFEAVNTAQNDDVIGKVNKALDGWLVSKNAPARFAEQFLKTQVPQLVAAWLASKPTNGNDHQALKTWRDAGYALLKGVLDHPWGMCSTCKKVKLMPITPHEAGKKTFIPKDCHDCYETKRGDNKTSGDDVQVDFGLFDHSVAKKTSGHKKPIHKPQASQSPEAIKAAKAARRQEKERKLAEDVAELQNLRPGRDGASKKRRDAEKQERAQGGHPEGKSKTKRKDAVLPEDAVSRANKPGAKQAPKNAGTRKGSK